MISKLRIAGNKNDARLRLADIIGFMFNKAVVVSYISEGV
jgi:hypothetical protein